MVTKLTEAREVRDLPHSAVLLFLAGPARGHSLALRHAGDTDLALKLDGVAQLGVFLHVVGEQLIGVLDRGRAVVIDSYKWTERDCWLQISLEDI